MAREKHESETIKNKYISNLRAYINSDSVQSLDVSSAKGHKIKNIIEDFNEDLSQMEKTLIDLKSTFYKEKLSEKELADLDKKEQIYPSNVKKFNNSLSTILSFSATFATILGTMFALAGPIAQWTGASILAASLTGIVIGSFVYPAVRFGSLGLFKLINKLSKNKLVKFAQKKQRARNLAAINIEEDLEKYLTKECNNFTEEKITKKVKRKKVKVTVKEGKEIEYKDVPIETKSIVLKEPYSKLPRYQRKKLLKALKKMDSLDSSLRTSKKSLSALSTPKKDNTKRKKLLKSKKNLRCLQKQILLLLEKSKLLVQVK